MSAPVDSAVVNRRKLIEAVRNLCHSSQPDAQKVEHVLDKLGLVVSDLTGDQLEAVLIRRKS